MPTCVNELAGTNSTIGVDWLHIQQSKGNRVWDLVLLAYAKIASHAPQPTSASPWINGAGGEDQVFAFTVQMN